MSHRHWIGSSSSWRRRSGCGRPRATEISRPRTTGGWRPSDPSSTAAGMRCGDVACCDSSPNRHASAHAREEEHPIVTSMEAGEDWSYCYVDDVAFVLQREA